AARISQPLCFAPQRPKCQDTSGSRVGCFEVDARQAGGMPATTDLLRREGGDDFFEARLAAEPTP
ncbi:MAG: hypothetical protein DME54_05320, partial [Verrucomicrobia bacterium]